MEHFIRKNYLPHGFYILLIIISYFIVLFLNKSTVFSYRFDQNLIERYERSQDIPHEVKGRIFLSDSEIHIAAGYLYVTGNDPTEYNFQHPPFIKYLYGLSTIFFGNPYIVQIAFGIALLILTYMLSFKLFGKSLVSIIACILLLVDPLFISLSSDALLDLGQSPFALSYLLSFIYLPGNYIVQGISLGILSGSKFWGLSLFLTSILLLYRLYRREFKYTLFLYHLLTAFVVFVLIYLPTFIARGGNFNIIFFELKTLKYWLNHSVSSIPAASLIMFVTGFYKSWWEHKEVVRSAIWSIFWPVGLIVSIIQFAQTLKLKNERMLIHIIPILYLLYLGVQAPFTRYFIFILPLIYSSLSFLIYRIFTWYGYSKKIKE